MLTYLSNLINYYKIKFFLENKERLIIILLEDKIFITSYNTFNKYKYSKITEGFYFESSNHNIISLIKNKTIYLHIENINYSIKKLIENNKLEIVIRLNDSISKNILKELSLYVDNIKKITIPSYAILKLVEQYLPDIIHINIEYYGFTSEDVIVILKFKKLKILQICDDIEYKCLCDINDLLDIIENSKLNYLDIRNCELNEEEYEKIITKTVLNSTIKHLVINQPTNYSEFDKLISKLTIYNDNIETIENYGYNILDVYTLAPDYIMKIPDEDPYYIGKERDIELALWRKRNSIKKIILLVLLILI